TQHRDILDDSDGRDLTLRLTDLSPGVRDTLDVRVYRQVVPDWLLTALGVLVLLGAVLIDTWRPKGANDGLMTTLTVATLVAGIMFRTSATSAPGFPQLIIAVLTGTL